MFRKDREESGDHDEGLQVVDDDVLEEELAEADAVRAHASGIVGFMGGALIGAIVGAGVALLVAPERGAVTRRRIRARFEDASDDAMDRFEDLRDDANRRLRKGQRRLRRRRNRAPAAD